MRSLEGWGAWAAAPMFLLPLGLSVGLGVWGLALVWQEHRRGGVRAGTLVATLVALSALGWLLVRRFVV